MLLENCGRNSLSYTARVWNTFFANDVSMWTFQWLNIKSVGRIIFLNIRNNFILYITFFYSFYFSNVNTDFITIPFLILAILKEESTLQYRSWKTILLFMYDSEQLFCFQNVFLFQFLKSYQFLFTSLFKCQLIFKGYLTSRWYAGNLSILYL